MALIYDIVTAPNISGYWDTRQSTVDSTVSEKLFPVKKQLGLKLGYVKGASGKPVVLQPAAFDTKVTLRERIGVELTEEEMPFFKEAMLVKEADRQQLMLLEQTGNQALIDTFVNGLFNDQMTLLSGAHARLEAMRLQVLATGKIAINSNGVFRDIDYGLNADTQKGAVKKTAKWSDKAKSNPLADIEDTVNKMEAAGHKPEVLYMNSATYANMKGADIVTKTIKPLAPAGIVVTKAEFETFISDNYGLKIHVFNQTYKNEAGQVVKYFPDGVVTFAPNSSLGYTVFGTTPEESDLMGDYKSGAEVTVVDTGIAITTKKLDDPVNVETKVSMIALPSFEQLDEIYLLDVEPA